MHEASLIQGMFDIIEQEHIQTEKERVTLIELEVGSLSNVEPVLFQQCFDVMKKGTKFEMAELKINFVQTEVYCTSCKKPFVPDGFPYICPDCGFFGGNLTRGDDILLRRLEIESD